MTLGETLQILKNVCTLINCYHENYIHCVSKNILLISQITLWSFKSSAENSLIF